MATKPATPEQFVVAWQRSDSRFALAKELNINLNTASTRAKTFRLKGIPLKDFQRVIIPKSINFGKRTTPGIVSQHRSRKGFPQGRLDIVGLKRLARKSLRK